MSLFADAFLTSLLYAAFFSLMALGLNLMFGVMRIVNLAHGEFIMMGSYAAIFLYSSYGLNPLVSLLVIIPLFTAVGMPLYFLLVPRLQRSDDPEMNSFILFFGLSFLMEGMAVQLFGNTPETLPFSSFRPLRISVSGITLPFAWVVVALVSALFVLLIYLLIYRTTFGLQTRALMINRDEAVANGVSVSFVSSVIFSLSIMLAAVAGAFSSLISLPTTPDVGSAFTLISFAVIIIGALGNPAATVAGGIVFAFAYGYSDLYLPQWAGVVPFILLVLIILARPEGLLGRASREF
ncbi:MAG: branched-chain amino acid ABC transporter permease [Thermoplasmata archaeon]|uniref:Branched-chain amino acid ABC transporter permease n=1 Tax=Candidatus Sysuiplasma superficiale TaxID=2823368 RepID=A0A8J7YSX7_9ARCH|nr:branched-chain amino acid ABC transporter permease [Candidatus Sysuiplasma superficiale]MBX8643884.1 branched-chain amino acid ABC transporter permease [Candidatus Sysuiplasma superficiale]MCL5437419.1 branched-chain amino acid ABC transporter permease [Candidatus Thermoplasmatota archaeon]